MNLNEMCSSSFCIVLLGVVDAHPQSADSAPLWGLSTNRQQKTSVCAPVSLLYTATVYVVANLLPRTLEGILCNPKAIFISTQ